MPYLIMTDGWPGYWGAGATEVEAWDNWRASGGAGWHHVLTIDPAYADPYVDVMGGVFATPVTDDDLDQRPPVIADRVGPVIGHPSRRLDHEVEVWDGAATITISARFAVEGEDEHRAWETFADAVYDLGIILTRYAESVIPVWEAEVADVDLDGDLMPRTTD